MAVSAADVKALREMTGLPMMECKNALTEADGDMARAKEILKEKGLAKAMKMADRVATDGRIAYYFDEASKRGAMIELRCETEPVSDTEEFIALAAAIAKAVAVSGVDSVEKAKGLPHPDDSSQTIGDRIQEVFNRMRENIGLARVETATGHVGRYVHFDSKKGTLVQFSAACPDDLSIGICQHVTAINPSYLNREDVDAKEVEAARAKFREESAGKPENIIENIVNGKMDRWYSDSVLLDQPYVRDEKLSVRKALAAGAPGAKIEKFYRFEVGVG